MKQKNIGDNQKTISFLGMQTAKLNSMFNRYLAENF